MSGRRAVRPEPKKVATDYVRKHYAQSPVFFEDRRTVAHWQTPDDIEYAGRQFDAWLAEHDAEVREAGYDEAMKEAAQCGPRGVVAEEPEWAREIRALHRVHRGVKHVYEQGDYDHELPPIGEEEYFICEYDKTTWPCRTQQIIDRVPVKQEGAEQ